MLSETCDLLQTGCFILFYFNAPLAKGQYFVNKYFCFAYLIQLKRSKGLKLFDLDKTVSEAVSATLKYQLTADGAVPVEVRIHTISKSYHL